MIVASISDSFLYCSTPWNNMFWYLLGVYKIGCKIIIILIYYNYTHRISCCIPIDTEKYSNVFLIRSCKRVICLSIETSDHQTLKRRWNLGFWKIHKVYKRNSWLPFARWCISPIWYCLRKSHTLTGISYLRKLRIFTVASITHRTWIRMICYRHEIFHIDSGIPCCQDLPVWNYSCFPVFCWNTNIQEWTNIWEWRLCWNRHILY